VPFPRLCQKTEFDVAQTLTTSTLSESQNTEVFGTGQHPDTIISIMTGTDTTKGIPSMEEGPEFVLTMAC